MKVTIYVFIIGLFFQMLVLHNEIYSQTTTNHANVYSYTIKDSLTYYSPVDPRYGRYEAYTITVGKGDELDIKLISKDFWPSFFLVSPSKKTTIVHAQKYGNIAEFKDIMTQTGNYDLYVISDTTETGKYSIMISFASANFIHLKKNAGFCESLDFIVNHANAEFIFLKGKSFKKNNYDSNTKITGSLSNKIIHNKIWEFHSLLFKSKNLNDAETFYRKLVSRVNNCLGETWWDEEKPARKDIIKQHKFTQSSTKGTNTVIVEIVKENQYYKVLSVIY